MSQPLIFYDIPGNAAKAWSPNTWKTRYCLNYKRIPYTTVWVGYPDIAPLCKKLGAPKTGAPPMAEYTLPTIYDPNTERAVSESIEIARYLDATYPDTPRLIPAEADALHAAFETAFRALTAPDMLMLILPPIGAQLNPRSAEYFARRRAEVFGLPLDAMAPAGSEKRAGHLAAMAKAFETIAGWLEAGEDKDKVLFMGDKVAYVDIVLASWLKTFRIVLGEESDLWMGIMAIKGGRWGKFAAAFEPYEAVDEGTNHVL